MPVGLQTPGDGETPRTPDEECRRWAMKHGMAYVDFSRVRIRARDFGTIPLVLQTEYACVPVRAEAETLYVAVSEPSARTRHALESFTGLRVVLVLATPEGIAKVRRRTLAEIAGEIADEAN